MISAVHGENDNGKLDKNFLGLPALAEAQRDAIFITK
jgi:uncharacterized protein (DUF2141 family)